MATEQAPDRLDAATADRLLAGREVAGHGPLTRLLASARAPGTDDDLAGEVAATLAFREAGVARPPGRRSSLKTSIARFITIKAATLVVVVGVGGVAIATNTGHIPDPTGHNPTDTKTMAPEHPEPSTPPRPSQRQSSVPDPSWLDYLSQLCVRYNANDRDRRRAALEHQSEFRDLINHVGGLDQARIDQLCDGLRNSPRSGGVSPWSHNGSPGPKQNLPVTPRPKGSWTKRPDVREFPPSVPRHPRPNSSPTKRQDHDPPAR
jgi:hypothetical protein